ncbi:conserved exported hypothetical protein [Sphingomonas aurantiaca]|uniref:Uncharacterized protein n=1 Tax=Sphingomonas aurantiaca TaxID=185949 RepID=A0A5E7ZRM8_9SPHN|nr:hypothetical protein [Sphingomonas aurantiaca]VVT21773.1 conserved exported hypothetical protein [Sphingomonas aurantiaca]
MKLRLFPSCLIAALLVPMAAQADPAPFDLTGPTLRVGVTHGTTTLPIAQVPKLATGDRVSVAADLPTGKKDDGTRYLLVAAFLRGATEPPPKSWFFKAETWKAQKNALALTVPEGARQLVVFLVPESGGFDAVISAVRKQPGAFVRAVQDLDQASLDRARLDAFLDGIHALERTRPERIEAVSPLLSRSLAIKLKAECLDLAADLQASCLTQSRDSLVLADGQSSTLADTLVGAPTDLALQLSATPEGGLGYYSPYIGVVRDLAKIFGAFQSTQFRYIPALARARDDRLALLLNAAPSFASPKSVMVVAMPVIETGAAQTPTMRRAEADRLVCAAKPDLVLPVEGAPLIYATQFAHDMMLRVTTPQGGVVELPVEADAERGGYVLDQVGMRTAGLGSVTDATLHGRWGFTPFDGPRFRLQVPRAGGWQMVDTDPESLVVGRDNAVALSGPTPSCVESVTLVGAAGDVPLAWTSTGDRIGLTLPLAKATPGKLALLVKQYGVEAPERIALTALAEAGRIDGFTVHAGDASGTLAGTRLDLVASMSVDGVTFKPGDVVRADKTDRLALVADTAPPFAAGQAKTALVTLSDGRKRSVKFAVAAARPKATLIAKSAVSPPASGLPVVLAGDTAIAQDARLTFSVRAEGTRFSPGDSIEIATADGTMTTSVTSGRGLTVQDNRIAVASVEPGKALGVSAHGPLVWRLVQGDVAGDWVPLTTLVRVPVLAGVTCNTVCMLAGSDLFLIDSVAASSGFAGAVRVSEGYTGGTLAVPQPAGGTLFLRLRDDPAVTATVAVKP